MRKNLIYWYCILNSLDIIQSYAVRIIQLLEYTNIETVYFIYSIKNEDSTVNSVEMK